MSDFYRKAASRKASAPMPFLDTRMTCDECGIGRAIGNHSACSKKRQQKYAKEKHV